MGLNLRKSAVGFLALSVLAGVFLLYMRLNRTPPIIVEASAPAPEPAPEAGGAGADESVGTFSGVGIRTVRKTHFRHRDEFGQIDREFGFEELLHEQGSQWQISRPYMRLYLAKFTCRVTADLGRVRISDAFGQPMPTDAVFTGNVVIHIIPSDPNGPFECFIHLDDVGFLAEKSLFSSTGAVRFLSHAVRLTGTGMELVYDSVRSRLELFRIFDLGSLRLRSSEIKAMSGKSSPGSEGRAGDDSPDGKGSRDNSTVASAAESTPSTPPDSNTPPADVYQCVFRRNVRLDSPDGLVFAQDVLAINSIQWARPAEPNRAMEQAADPNAQEPVVLPAPKTPNAAASSYLAMISIPDDLYDIVVKCDGGAEIMLTSDRRAPVDPVAAKAPEGSPADAAREELTASDRQQIAARRIDFDFSTRDTKMLGPVAMKFLVDPNSLGEKAGGAPMPMEVTAQRAVRFLAASEQITLEGDATATLHRSDPNFSDEYRLAAPLLTLNLAIDANGPNDVKVNLRRLVAEGGATVPEANDAAAASPVAVRMWRRVADRVLGEASLDTHELHYDTDANSVTAVGPGVIWLHNAETIRSGSDPNSTFEPCYAQLRNFDTLTYGLSSNRIVAADDSEQLLLNYFPLIDGKYGPQTQVVAGHVEATLQEIVAGRMGLASLVASRGISYNNEVEHSEFVGSEMVYDRTRSLLTIRGDDARPCYLNGVLVDHIVVNPRTGEVVEARPTTSVFEVRP